MEIVYEPLTFLKGGQKILLMILNLPIRCNDLLKFLWKSATVKICCDGGANQLLHVLTSYDEKELDMFPNFICGDLDSLTENTKKFFTQKGTQVKLLEDQDETDFTKSLRFALSLCKDKEIEYDVIIAYPAFGGRFDQNMANVNTLFKIKDMTDKPCYLVSETDVVCLLKPGKTRLLTNTGFEGKMCGLIPIGAKAEKVTTTGLKYNLDGQSMEFGTLISTSNSLEDDSDHVTVISSHHLLWTLSYKF